MNAKPKLQHFPQSSQIFPLFMTLLIKWKMFCQQFNTRDTDNSMGISRWTKTSIWKERKDMEGAINTRKGCWKVKTVFVTYRTMKRWGRRADVVLSRVLVGKDKRK